MYDLLSFKPLVIQYLEFLIAEDFNYSYDLNNELIFTENIVSKNIIVMQDFSKQIEEDAKLRDYLLIIISNINLRIIRTEDMFLTLN